MEGCGRPLPDAQITEILNLYGDCKRRAALPDRGGVLGQDAETMYYFREIDKIIERHSQEKRERERWQTSKQISS